MSDADQPDELPRALPSMPVGSRADQVLRESLTVLRDRATDPEAVRLYDDILHGRRSARELTSSPVFAQSAEHGFAEYTRRRGAMTDAERDQQDEQARELFDDETP